MCKKVLVAAVVVVAALVVLNFTRVGSHLRLMKRQAGAYIQKQIPPEQELARMEMELKELERSDAHHFHKVAVQRVEVRSYEKQVEDFGVNHKNQETSIAAMLATEAKATEKDAFVTHNGTKYARQSFQNDLRIAGRVFKTEEARLEAMKQSLVAKKQSLKMNEEKLGKLKLTREQMRAELEQVRTDLERERQAAASEKDTLDDAGFVRSRESLNSLRKRISVMQEERNLKAEFAGPSRASEKAKKQAEEDDAYLKARFGDNKQ